jgi:pimeloyl-ACP methyl ester carboxylesterase
LDCEALRKNVGVDRWTVVGYSFGAIIALQYAALQPERVRAVCAVSPLIVPWWASFAMRYFRLPIAVLLRLARRLPPSLSGAMAHNIAKTRLRTLFHTVKLMRGWNPQEVTIAPRARSCSSWAMRTQQPDEHFRLRRTWTHGFCRTPAIFRYGKIVKRLCANCVRYLPCTPLRPNACAR